MEWWRGIEHSGYDCVVNRGVGLLVVVMEVVLMYSKCIPRTVLSEIFI